MITQAGYSALQNAFVSIPGENLRKRQLCVGRKIYSTVPQAEKRCPKDDKGWLTPEYQRQEKWTSPTRGSPPSLTTKGRLQASHKNPSRTHDRQKHQTSGALNFAFVVRSYHQLLITELRSSHNLGTEQLLCNMRTRNRVCGSAARNRRRIPSG